MFVEHAICVKTDYVLLVANSGSITGRARGLFLLQRIQTSSGRPPKYFPYVPGKYSGCESNLSTPSSVEATNKCSYTSNPPRCFIASRQKKNYRWGFYIRHRIVKLQKYIKRLNRLYCPYNEVKHGINILDSRDLNLSV